MDRLTKIPALEQSQSYNSSGKLGRTRVWIVRCPGGKTDTRISCTCDNNEEFYQLSYQGNSAGRGSNLQLNATQDKPHVCSMYCWLASALSLWSMTLCLKYTLYWKHCSTQVLSIWRMAVGLTSWLWLPVEIFIPGDIMDTDSSVLEPVWRRDKGQSHGNWVGVFQGLKLPVCRVEDTIRLPWQHQERYAYFAAGACEQGPLAQSVERGADNAKAVSSRLTWTKFFCFWVFDTELAPGPSLHIHACIPFVLRMCCSWMHAVLSRDAASP